MAPTPYLPPSVLPDEDWAADDPALHRFLARRLSAGALKDLAPRLEALGRAAPHEIDALARRADAQPPTLADNVVTFDASYGELQRAARDHEVFTLGWRRLGEHERAPRLACFALGYLYAQAESGYYCPACMTDGAAFVLERHASKEVAAQMVPRLVQREAKGAFEGAMLLTEKTGGSDVGATTTTATPHADGMWRLTGDKWFASNANADVILTLARMPDAPAGTRGLGLFVMPAFLADGSANPGIHRKRLKDKLGVRSMATAEIELRDAHARLISGANEGFRHMAEMVNLSRLYNAVASIAVARRALREGQKNGTYRQAFGKPLADAPLYAAAVARLAIDVRGALLVVLDTADTFDRSTTDDADAYPLLRALTPLVKAATARLAVDAASTACEFLGGNGYIEEWVTPRLLRDAQVLPIWEGTTNVQALDFLRACAKDGAAQALAADSLRRIHGTGAPPALADAWAAWGADVARSREPQAAELASLRLMMQAFHLRAATLLAEDAIDGDAEARLHADAYLARHITRDDEAFDALVLADGKRLAGFGLNPIR